MTKLYSFLHCRISIPSFSNPRDSLIFCLFACVGCCSIGVQEPQKKDEIRPEALLFQINTKSESEEVALDPSYPADEFFDAMKRGEAAGLKVNPIYGDASALLNPIAPKIPFFSAKIFHPTTKGHAKIVGAFPAQF
jgi:hypothetical protein